MIYYLRYTLVLIETTANSGVKRHDESLAGHTEPVEGLGWPPPRSYPVRECLLVILNEEYCHRQFAERDLDALQARGT